METDLVNKRRLGSKPRQKAVNTAWRYVHHAAAEPGALCIPAEPPQVAAQCHIAPPGLLGAFLTELFEQLFAA